MIDTSVRPVLYNNTESKQYGTCYITVQFKTKSPETKCWYLYFKLYCYIKNFFVVDHTTTLIGLIDRISLCLIIVNCFDSLISVSDIDESEVENCDNNDYFSAKTDMKCQDKLISNHFKTVILTEYRELFSGIGKLDGEIKIT